MRISLVLSAVVLISISGCSEQSSEPAPSVTIAETSPNIPVLPDPPNYDDTENGTYYYVSVVSEEEQKKGKAAGDVVAFRYLGQNDKSEHVIAHIFKDGRTINTLYCKDPCKIIRSNDGERTAYNAKSIIGSAFEDAIAGRLANSSKSASKSEQSKPDDTYPKTVSSVPKAFHGRWDEIVNDGCEGREARFYFDNKKFMNFEVDWSVTKVKLYSETEMDLSTSTFDEDKNQVDEIWEFKLVDNGKTLTGRKKSASFFKRCA